jgi:hypothetical protein
MLAHAPALSITGKGVSVKAARELAGALAASGERCPMKE